MYRLFGLSRDPFAPAGDAALFWEDSARAETRETALSVLRAGRGVWISGDPGSGRGAFLNRLAGDAALEGRCVVFRGEPAPDAAQNFLASLLAVTGEEGTEGDALAIAERLYARLLDAFSRSGTVIIVPGIDRLSQSA